VVTMKSSIACHIALCSQVKGYRRSGGTSSIFRVEEQAKKETSMQQAVCFILVSFLFLDPEY
jgi:hypothetical protein